MHSFNISCFGIKQITDFFKTWGLSNNKMTLTFDESLMEGISFTLSKENSTHVGIIQHAPDNTKSLEIRGVIVEWYNVGGKKAVLKKVTDSETNKQIYICPQMWDMQTIFFVY